MNKTERQLIIKEMIKNKTIRNQEDLLAALRKQNISVTQSTVSRDIRELKIVKDIDSTGQVKFSLFQEHDTAAESKEQHLVNMIGDIVVKVEHVHFLTIVHTISDNAALLSSIIDDVSLPGVTCTIAGFDTVIIISPTEKEAIKLEEYFLTHLF